MQADAIKIDLPSEAHTKALAETFADCLQKGSTVLLSGNLGAGKSYFARSFIRHRLGQNTDVPSPTFTLVQVYDDGPVEIWHCDLYRLTSVDELIELGLDDAFEEAICLIEWPERLGDLAPETSIHVELLPSPFGRTAIIRNATADLSRALVKHV